MQPEKSGIVIDGSVVRSDPNPGHRNSSDGGDSYRTQVGRLRSIRALFPH